MDHQCVCMERGRTLGYPGRGKGVLASDRSGVSCCCPVTRPLGRSIARSLATLACVSQVDEVGRKPFLLGGAMVFAGGLLFLSLGFAVESAAVSYAACCIVVAAYALSFGPVTWLVTAEMFPASVRGKALGIGQVRYDITTCRTALIPTLYPTRCYLWISAPQGALVDCTGSLSLAATPA